MSIAFAERRSSSVRSREGMDLGLFFGLVTLGLFGVFMIYSATRAALINAGDNPHYYVERQGPFVLIGILVMFVFSRFDYRRLEHVATPAYLFGIASLLGVFVAGSRALGAQRWYNLGIVQVQPSEFVVLFIILSIATFCSRRSEGLRMYDVVRLLVMASVPLALVFLQPDMGTSIIIVLVVATMLVIAGVPPRFMTFLAIAGALGLTVAVYLDVLKKYQIQRLTSFFNQNSSNQAISDLIYQVNNAKTAIGSGGLWGAGPFRGLQTILGYVPEQRTDFIFTAIGEQLGFFGSVTVLMLIAFVAWRMWVIARHARDEMGRLIAIGVFIFFAFSCFENIGMTMGVMPMTGIPLPLMSYGGSSAMVFYAAGGVVLSVSRRMAPRP